MRIDVNHELCIGAGMCALIAPQVFDQDVTDGRVVLLQAQPTSTFADAAGSAVSLCPSGAISIRPINDDRTAEASVSDEGGDIT